MEELGVYSVLVGNIMKSLEICSTLKEELYGINRI